MTAYLVALLSLSAHAESCEKQYEHARANGNQPWCQSVVKPDSLAGDYCITYEGPTVAPTPMPTVKPLTVKALKAAPKPVHANPSAKHGKGL